MEEQQQPINEIDKFQKGESKEEEKFIDVVINKNMKLGQKVLIPVKQFPKLVSGKKEDHWNLWICLMTTAKKKVIGSVPVEALTYNDHDLATEILD